MIAEASKHDHELADIIIAVKNIFQVLDDEDKYFATGGGTCVIPDKQVFIDILERYCGEDAVLVDCEHDMPDVHTWCPTKCDNGCAVCRASPPINATDDNATKRDRQMVINNEMLQNYLANVKKLIDNLKGCSTRQGAKSRKMPMCPADIVFVATQSLETASQKVVDAISRLEMISSKFHDVCRWLDISYIDTKPQQMLTLGKQRFMILYPDADDSDVEAWFTATLENVQSVMYSAQS